MITHDKIFLMDLHFLQLPQKADETHGICYRCGHVWKNVDKLSNFLKHVREAKCTRPPPPEDWKCPTCTRVFARKATLDDHKCPLFPPVARLQCQVEYTCTQPSSSVHQKILGLPELEAYEICFQDKLAVPGVFPPVFVPLQQRGVQRYGELGNVNGTKFLHQALKQKVLRGQSNELLLNAAISVVTGPRQELGYLSPSLLRPTSGLLRAENVASGLIKVSLVNPPKPKGVSDPLACRDIDNLEVFSRYKVDAGEKYPPHFWPQTALQGLLLFPTPH